MKSKKIMIAILAILAISLSFTACKKTNSSSLTNTTDSAQTQSDDEVMVNNATDQVSNDVTSGIEGSGGSFASRPAATVPAITLPCDAPTISYDTTGVATDTITIAYTGSTCEGTRTRTGKIIISFAPSLHWGNANASVTVDYDSLTIKRIIDGKTILINGTMTYTNVSGGLLENIVAGNSITHTVAGSLNITFNNGAQATWQISKQRVFTYNNGIIITTTGTGTGGIATSGTNRFGNQFTSAITQPRIIEESCGFSIVSGQSIYTGPNAIVTTTLGLDINGNPVSDCPQIFYYKESWLINGRTYSFIGAY